MSSHGVLVSPFDWREVCPCSSSGEGPLSQERDGGESTNGSGQTLTSGEVAARRVGWFVHVDAGSHRWNSQTHGPELSPKTSQISTCGRLLQSADTLAQDGLTEQD